MFIYDSAKKAKVKFEPIKQGFVSFYVCGPTVYDDAHLGHARSSIVFDLWRRLFLSLNYSVKFVKNYTDIDDKIIKKMQDSNQSLEEITSFYIKRYEDDMDALFVLKADILPKATKSLESIQNIISNLAKKGFVYEIEDGFYFDTKKDEKYLSLSQRQTEENQTRIELNLAKKDEKDFVLWKKSKENEPSFNSSFGKGRPGWHIECSAMIKEHLANDGEYQIDIHAGGADLLFPHHENEAAQTRCAYEQNLAKYWLHNGFVNINNEKMSKSLGNSFFIKDALKVYNGEVLRFYLLCTHYRANLNFNEQDLLQSKKRLDKIYRLKKRISGFSKMALDESFKQNLLDVLSDDLNISKALAIIEDMISNSNESLDKNPKDKALKAQILGNLEFIKNLLGIGNLDENEYFQIGVSEEFKLEIEEKIKQRNEAKKEKDYQKADEIREFLKERQILLQDTPDGTIWEKEEIL